MKLIAATVGVLALCLLGCGGAGSSESAESGSAGAEFHDSALGIDARLPVGWSARRARLGRGALREDLIAGSFRIPRTPVRHTTLCRSEGSIPPPGGVGVLIYEHPGLDGARLAHLKNWFPLRPAHFYLGRPANQEGYYGYNLFFQDRRRALQAQVCVHRGVPFAEGRRRQTERFLNSLSFSTPRSVAVASGSATVTCDSGGPYIGSGKPGWRRLSAHAGPFGLSGAGREFRRIPRRERDGLFHTELPAIVEGHRAVTLWVQSGERKRVGIEVVAGDHPYARVRFVPCEDKSRTIWPVGLALLNRSPVILRVRVGRSVGELRVGRVPAGSSS
jgi:hypothetical protein